MFMDNMIAPINVYSIKLKHYLQNMTAERLRYEFKNDFFFWFLCCSTREDLSIDVSITNVGLILTKLR